jgi:hypothetical protein
MGPCHMPAMSVFMYSSVPLSAEPPTIAAKVKLNRVGDSYTCECACMLMELNATLWD